MTKKQITIHKTILNQVFGIWLFGIVICLGFVFWFLVIQLPMIVV